MRVIQVTGSVSRAGGGLHSALLGLVPALTSQGIDVAVHGLLDNDWSRDQAQWLNAQVNAHPVYGPGSFGFAPTMLPRVLDFQPDVVHCHGLWKYPSIVSLIASGRREIPHVVSPHGMLNTRPLSVAAWKKRLAAVVYERRHVLSASLLHALSMDEARSFRRFGFRGPICLLPNGVPIVESNPIASPPWRGVIRRDAKVLLYLGRKDPIKNLPGLISAWGEIERDGSRFEDWTLVIAGWGLPDYETAVERSVARSGLKRAVVLGPLYAQDKIAALTNADAFCLVSLSEALPMAALEASAYGIPLVVSRACNLSKLASADAAVEVDTAPDSIAMGLRALFRRTESDRVRMGERGRALVRAEYSWEAIAAQFCMVYAWLSGTCSPPGCVLTDESL